MLTLVGPGGVGKTRLAVEAAHRVAESGRRVWWADLSAVTPDRLVDTLAQATGVDMPGASAAPHVLAGSMRHLDGTLCLDNAETVLADVALAVEHILTAAPRLTVLATSRERLAVPGEHVHLVAPLALPSGSERGPAVELFLNRASALESSALSPSDLADIVELCRRLDGIPLALELAAARAPAFGIREFSEQVRAEIDLLAGGRRTVTRHQTMRAVVDASYRLLTEPEALLFERLAVFPDHFRLADVRVVCSDDRLSATSVGGVLARLVEQSMVQAGDGRFRLLDTLRTYAAERLGAEEHRLLRARHARPRRRPVTGLRFGERREYEAECVARAREHDQPQTCAGPRITHSTRPGPRHQGRSPDVRLPPTPASVATCSTQGSRSPTRTSTTRSSHWREEALSQLLARLGLRGSGADRRESQRLRRRHAAGRRLRRQSGDLAMLAA